VGFQTTISASERAKTIYALDGSTTVTGIDAKYQTEFECCQQFLAYEKSKYVE
jgi:hypothetical protein